MAAQDDALYLDLGDAQLGDAAPKVAHPLKQPLPSFPLLAWFWRTVLYCAIISDIMDKRKLSRLRKRIQVLRARLGNIRSRELVSLARALGRKPSVRGKEPTFVSALLPHARPLSIPEHPHALKKGTAGSILDQLEADIDALEEQ